MNRHDVEAQSPKFSRPRTLSMIMGYTPSWPKSWPHIRNGCYSAW